MSDLSNDTGAGAAGPSGGAPATSNGSAASGAGDASKTGTKAPGAVSSGGTGTKASSTSSPDPATSKPAISSAPAAGPAGRISSASESEDDIGGGEGVSRLKATIQKLEDKASELRRWGVARQDDAREIVEDKPLVVVGAAFGVGLLLGILAARV